MRKDRKSFWEPIDRILWREYPVLDDLLCSDWFVPTFVIAGITLILAAT